MPCNITRSSRIYLAGNTGLVGSSIERRLRESGFSCILTAGRKSLDLRDGGAVERWFSANRFDAVIMAAGKVGGIAANIEKPAEFFFDNMSMSINVIHASKASGIKRIVYLGSSCIYPRECPQPMKEDHLFTGPLEPTNRAYAAAKLAAFEMALAYQAQYGLDIVCPIPCNLYGEAETFDLAQSHVLAALVKRFVDAKVEGRRDLVLWGTGTARRELLHAEDLARAVELLLLHPPSPVFINVGSGIDHSIKELAALVGETVGYDGQVKWDASKPDGMPRKCLDTTKIQRLGFVPAIGIKEGIKRMVSAYDFRRSQSQQPKGAK